MQHMFGLMTGHQRAKLVTQHKMGGQMGGWTDAGMDVQYVNGKPVTFTKMLSNCCPVASPRHKP